MSEVSVRGDSNTTHRRVCNDYDDEILFFLNWFDIEHLYQSPNYSRVQPVSLTLLPSQGELMIHLLSLFIIGFDHQSMLLDVGSMDFIWS